MVRTATGPARSTPGSTSTSSSPRPPRRSSARSETREPMPSSTTTPKPDSNGKNGHAPTTPDRLDHRQLLAGLRAFKRGDFSARLRDDLTGVDGQICETFNELVGLARAIRDEASEVCTAVGKEGRAQ